MNTENIQCCQNMDAQVILKGQTLDKSGEIFTIRFTDSPLTYATNSQSACEGDNMGLGADYKRMGADECGPDLFFENWNFTDTPQELEPA